MQGQTVRIVSQAIRYIEEHLHEKMDLDMVASTLHYSKYHLHRIFTKTVDLTIHDYAKAFCSLDAIFFHPLYLRQYPMERHRRPYLSCGRLDLLWCSFWRYRDF